MENIPFKTFDGQAEPFGVSFWQQGINFSLVAKDAKAVTLCLFEKPHEKPFYEVILNPQKNRTGDVWHVLLNGLKLPLFYMYRVDGKDKQLMDPYGRSLETCNKWGGNLGKDPKTGKIASTYEPTCALFEDTFDWEGDKPIDLKIEDLVIYEMHVRGFTQHASSGTKQPGTFLGIIEKIPYLKELGVNAVELLPIHEFNEGEYDKFEPKSGKRLYNYWGYSTVNFFAPMQRYASQNSINSAVDDFRTMVKELHKNGIEVILDVVFNHTAEGGNPGVILSYKGLGNSTYYMLDYHGNYLNFSGCGNTFNCNHPVARELIRSSLRYWRTEMHVDGFRFDLASILTRGTHGQPLVYSPLIEAISFDPVLANVKLIAEPWDAGGLYQVGSFYKHGEGRWHEWNGRYRDVVRRFIKGTISKKEFSTVISGCQDMYYQGTPCNSVNFLTSHDGFSLADLVSYNHKHNERNGENNRDGSNENDSWNCGVEGPTNDTEILKLRERQMKNFHFALMISRGIPMITMGDEYAHTKQGNNNTWCHDDELNWFLWNQLDTHQPFYRFCKSLIHFRHQNPILKENRFLTDEDIEWHGRAAGNPLWDVEDHFVGFSLKANGESVLYIAFNADAQTAAVELPSAGKGKGWFWVVNTANESPNDFFEQGPAVKEGLLEMIGRSALMLVTRPIEEKK